MRQAFLPGSLVMTVSETQAERLAALATVFDNKPAFEGKAAVYVCRHGRCELPITDGETLRRAIEAESEYSF